MMPNVTPSTAPIMKPRMVSSNVVAICSHSGPCAVPCVTQVTSCAQIPEGCPQKNGSMTPTLVRSCHPPMITTRISTRRLLTMIRRRRRAAMTDGTTAFSRTPLIVSGSLLITFIANQYLLAQVFPDALVQFDKTGIETDVLHFARATQVDGINTLDGGRPGSEDADAISERNGLLQIMRDKDDRSLERRPERE